MNTVRRFPLILMLGSLIAVSPFAIDMYLPAFQMIAAEMRTSTATVALSLSSYFVGLAMGQLLYGPLLDRFGRKKPLYVGLCIFILSCIGCANATSVDMLIVLRFVQALGGCVAGVAAMTMVRDFFPVEESAKIFSLMMLVLGLSPLLAPTVGGFVTAHFGWKYVFATLGVMAIVLLLVMARYLPHGQPADPSVSLKPKPILRDFWQVLKQPQFATYALAGAFSFGSLFVYVAGSPIIFMDRFAVNAQTYGMIFAVLSIGFIGGNQVNVLLMRWFKSAAIFRVALAAQALISVVFLFGAYHDWYELRATVVIFFLMLSCLGLTSPNASANALAPFTARMGTASSALGFLQMSIGALISSGVGLFDARDSVPTALLMTFSSVCGLIIYLIGKRKINRQRAPAVI